MTSQETTAYEKKTVKGIITFQLRQGREVYMVAIPGTNKELEIPGVDYMEPEDLRALADRIEANRGR